MSDQWVETTLEDACRSIKRGKAPKYVDEGRLVLNQKCVRDGNRIDFSLARQTELSRALPEYAYLRVGDVLINSTGRGTLGRAAELRELSEPATADSHITIVRPDPERFVLGFAGLILSMRKADFESLQTGSTNQTELSAKTIASVSIVLPPIRVQERIVEIISAVDDQISALDDEARALESVYRAAASLLWCTNDGNEADLRFLGEAMHLDVVRTRMEAGKTYHLAGVLNAGKGLVDKDEFDGADTEYTAMNVLRENQVVMRKLTAWEGPITVVPVEFDGFVASNEFPTFTLAGDIAPGWMKHVCRTPRLWAEMQSRVVGTVQRRKRLNPDQLLSVALPIPSRPEQEQAAEALDSIEGQIAELRAEGASLRQARARLLAGLLDRTIDIESAELEV
ncbi:restriction endonuclease subunit S [Streptomyces millisiae]|uniref:Restriction endonuclease subunit S n=1 Tax=Streptomyces millisiae TaxID=3075542 RepID=A0ABU2LLL3_9ACTN|nr:restriction endonuclease subunit S [Streptomyces sp. DSM 44918]MDT0318473.1 restriction endonuclease subunit S [Streptomyces sp. DSM 44918]